MCVNYGSSISNNASTCSHLSLPMCQCQFVSHVVTTPLQIGARALILSPTRELAMQTNKFTKEVTTVHIVRMHCCRFGSNYNFALAKILYACCIKFDDAIS